MKKLPITKGLDLNISHLYRFNWFISQIALAALKYNTNVSGVKDTCLSDHRFIFYLGWKCKLIFLKMNCFFLKHC